MEYVVEASGEPNLYPLTTFTPVTFHGYACAPEDSEYWINNLTGFRNDKLWDMERHGAALADASVSNEIEVTVKHLKCEWNEEPPIE